MKRLYAALLVLFFIASCSKEDETKIKTCDFSDPIEELQWLKEIRNTMTNCSCELSILLATYNNQTVFYVAMTDPLCNGVQTTTLLDCEGKVIEVIQSEKYQAFLGKVSNVKNLYRCKTTN